MSQANSFNWNDLRYFLEVARTGRLTDAARRLRQDHTTVSRRLTSLEAALGTQLFERGPEGYRLTKPGEQLLVTAERIESTTLTIRSEMHVDENAIEGRVVIGSPASFGSYFLSNCLGRLAEELPGVEVELLAISKVFNVARRDADIVVTFSCPTEGRLFVRKLCDFGQHVYASRSFLDRHPPIHSTNDLLHLDFISYADIDMFRPDLDYARQIDPQIVPKHLISAITAQLEAARAGIGLCVLPDFVARQAPELTPVLPEEIAFVRSLWLVAHADQHDLPHIRAVSDFIAREVRKSRAILSPVLE